MSDVFDTVYEATSPCCGESLHWEWDGEELQFDAECECMKRYKLTPATAQVDHDSEEFESDDE